MSDIPNDHTHLWNDLPYEERNRLMPYMVEDQILHLEQARAKVVRGHQRTLAEFDDHIKNLKASEHLKPSVLSTPVKCPECDGDGQYWEGDPQDPEAVQCEKCEGTGFSSVSEVES